MYTGRQTIGRDTNEGEEIDEHAEVADEEVGNRREKDFIKN